MDRSWSTRSRHDSDLKEHDVASAAADDQSTSNMTTTGSRLIKHHNDPATKCPRPGAPVTCLQTARSLRPLSLRGGQLDDSERAATLSAVSTTHADDAYCPRYMSKSSNDDPGRLTNIELLERIFPLQQRHVVQQVLAECNGDLVKAEQFLSVQDAYSACHHGQDKSSHQTINVATDGGRLSVETTAAGSMSVNAAHDQVDVGSSWTSVHATLARWPLSDSLYYPSSFSRRASAAFMTDNLLAASRILAQHSLMPSQSSVDMAFPSAATLIPFFIRPQRAPQWNQRAASDQYIHQITASAGHVLPSVTMHAIHPVPRIRQNFPSHLSGNRPQ